jgi:hypothetical protein
LGPQFLCGPRDLRGAKCTLNVFDVNVPVYALDRVRTRPTIRNRQEPIGKRPSLRPLCLLWFNTLVKIAREESDLVIRTASSQALGAVNLATNKASEIIRGYYGG